MTSRPRQLAGIVLLVLAAALAVLAALRQLPMVAADVRILLPRLLLLAEALAAAGIAAWVGFRHRSSVDRRVLLTGAIITAAALALRLLLPPWAFFHENRHGYRYLLEIFTGQSGYLPPSTYYVLMHLFTRIFGPSEATIFVVNALFSAATVPLVGLVARQISGRAVAGWAAMGLWALSPHAIRMGPTETYYNVGVFFLFAGTAATIHALRTMEDTRFPIPALILAACLSALAAQTRALTLLWPATILLLAYGARVVATRRQWLGAFAIGLGTAALMLPKVLGHLSAGGASNQRFFDPTMLYTGLHGLPLFDPNVISPFLPPLILAGVVALLRGSRRLGVPATLLVVALFVVPATAYVQLILDPVRFMGFANVLDFSRAPSLMLSYLVGTAALTLVFVWLAARTPRRTQPRRGVSLAGLATLAGVLFPFAVTNSIENRLVSSMRFDLGPHALLAVLAGVGIASLTALLPKGRWSPAVRALPVILVLTTLTAIPLTWRPFADPVEHEFLRDVVTPSLGDAPAPVALVVPLEREGSGRIHPEWWQLTLPEAVVVETLQDLPPEVRASARAYIGYTCYWTHAEPPVPHPVVPHVEGKLRLHPRCAEALSGAQWSAVEVLEMPWTAGWDNVRPFPTDLRRVVIGLYDVRELDAPATP